MELLQVKRIEIKTSNSIISFQTTGGGAWKEWDRFITIEGKKAYHIGNICGTCNFFFERLEGANQKVSQKAVINEVSNKTIEFDSDTYFEIEKLIPVGKYYVFKITIHPRFIVIGSNSDYFTKEDIETFGLNSFWGLPHYPKINYYRENDIEINDRSKLFNFFIPIVPESWLDNNVINEYKDKMDKGIVPTAIAISHIDAKEPADWEDGKKHTKHICFANYIMDGHHKLFAAAAINKPITLLSFLSIDNSICSEEEWVQVKNVLNINV